MNLSVFLNIIIPVAIFVYAIFLVWRMRKRKKNGFSCGGCSGCPMAGSCEKQSQSKEDPSKDE